MDNTKLQYDSLLGLDQGLLTVPVEQLKRDSRTSQRLLEAISNHFSSLLKTTNVHDPTQALSLIKEIIQKLSNLLNRLSETRDSETIHINHCISRISHLNTLFNIDSIDSLDFKSWCGIKTNRLLIDFLLRQGYKNTANLLVSTSNNNNNNNNSNDNNNNNDTGKNLMYLSDNVLFDLKDNIELSLKNHSCTQALKWVNENRSSLKKIDPSFEFNLRLQEFIELIRNKKYIKGMDYIRKYILPFRNDFPNEVSHATALLAFNSNTTIPIYNSLFSNQRWLNLSLQFRKAIYHVHGLPSRPPLIITLQAGLTALKTPKCTLITNSCNHNNNNNNNNHNKLLEPMSSSSSTSSTISSTSSSTLETRKRRTREHDTDNEGEPNENRYKFNNNNNNNIYNNNINSNINNNTNNNNQTNNELININILGINGDCPVCGSFIQQELCKTLPYAHRIHTVLVDPETGKLIDPANAVLNNDNRIISRSSNSNLDEPRVFIL